MQLKKKRRGNNKYKVLRQNLSRNDGAFSGSERSEMWVLDGSLSFTESTIAVALNPCKELPGRTVIWDSQRMRQYTQKQ